MSRGFQTILVAGIATYLSGQGIGVWRTDGMYTAAEVGIVVKNSPQQPERVIVLTPYGVSDAAVLSDSTIGLQVRCRAGSDPRDVDDLTDQVFDALQGLQHLVLEGGLHLVAAARQSGPVSLGQDENGRWMTSQNFYLLVHRPSTHRL